LVKSWWQSNIKTKKDIRGQQLSKSGIDRGAPDGLFHCEEVACAGPQTSFGRAGRLLRTLHVLPIL
jgi:hypothetical protein